MFRGNLDAEGEAIAVCLDLWKSCNVSVIGTKDAFKVRQRQSKCTTVKLYSPYSSGIVKNIAGRETDSLSGDVEFINC